MNSIRLVGTTIYYNHEHDLAAIIESYVLDIYNVKMLRAGDYIIDLGAGIGEFSILASKIVGDKGMVIAVEPSPIDFSTLKLNLDTNTLKLNLDTNNCNNVIPVNFALSDKDDEELMLSFKGREFTAHSVTLATLLTNLKIDPSIIKFVKIDIEGAELYVLPQAVQILPNVNIISIELHGNSIQKMVTFMKNKGFNFYRINKRTYISNAMKFAMTHPLQAYRLFKIFRRTKDYPGMSKILSGIEISSGSSLAVGQFKRVQ